MAEQLVLAHAQIAQVVQSLGGLFQADRLIRLRLPFSPRLRCKVDSGIHQRHQDIAKDHGNDGNNGIEQGDADNNAVIIRVNRVYQQSADTGYNIYPFSYEGTDHCSQDGTGNASDRKGNGG